jgi:hypothetical protein
MLIAFSLSTIKFFGIQLENYYALRATKMENIKTIPTAPTIFSFKNSLSFKASEINKEHKVYTTIALITFSVVAIIILPEKFNIITENATPISDDKAKIAPLFKL